MNEPSSLTTQAKRSVFEDNRIRHFHQRVQAIRREFPGEHVGISGIGIPEAVNELR